MRRRVVVTGLGCLTPVGNDVTTTWNNLLNGVSGVDYITHFDASTFPSKIAGEVKQFDPTALPVDKKLLDYAGRVSQLGIAAALMAVEDAHLAIEKLDLTRVGSSVGASGEYPDIEQLSYYHRFKGDGGWDYKAFADSAHIPSTWVFRRSVHTVSLIMAKLFKFLGPNMTIHTACASGSYAIGQAFRVIERGDAEVMITGGTDAISSPLWVAAFGLLGALSSRQIEPQKASRPFDAMRDGFVIGEGAGMLILEELSFALHRGAKIYAEIVPGQVDYINSEGNATLKNDLSETRTFKKVFGKKAYDIPISTIKPVIGHSGAASSAIELIITALALERGIVPPTINCISGDPECDLDYVPNNYRPKEMQHAISVNKGIGGQNCVFILKEYPSLRRRCSMQFR